MNYRVAGATQHVRQRREARKIMSLSLFMAGGTVTTFYNSGTND